MVIRAVFASTCRCKPQPADILARVALRTRVTAMHAELGQSSGSQRIVKSYQGDEFDVG
jgi:hypothetical protein